MREQALAWKRLLPIWLPAALFLAFNVGALVWLSGKTVGRQAQVTNDVQRLEEKVARLERFRLQATDERAAVEKLYENIAFLNEKVFGSLDERLTPILRDVGKANRVAGLRPGRFAYDATKLEKIGLFELGITFKVTGRYAQFVDLLNALRASPQFLVVDTIRLTGEKGTASDELKVGIHISTYLARADETLLKALTAGKKTGGGTR